MDDNGTLEVMETPYERLCYVKTANGDVPALLYFDLSTNQMAKICHKDGTFRDVFWSKVTLGDAEDRIDELTWEE